jgi:hypothetical protein
MPSVVSSVGYLTGRYGRRMIDLDRGWATERLDLEPLAVARAAGLSPTGEVHDGETRWVSPPTPAP